MGGQLKKRKHGLEMPLNMYQVSTFVVIILIAVGCYVLFLPFTEDRAAYIVLVTLYTTLLVAVLILAYLATVTDPSDPGVSRTLNEPVPDDADLYCDLCEAHVHNSSKHCRACGRCTEGFDHHCKWLNNCIGGANYKWFFWTVSSTVALLTLQSAWGLWLFIISFTQRAAMELKVASVYGTGFSYKGWQASLIIYLVLLAAAIFGLGELLIFHVVLIYKDMTTYDFITAQRNMRMVHSQMPIGSSGARAALCRSSRVAPDPMDGIVVPQRKPKVAINPCQLCFTDKPDFNNNFPPV